jgi:hypothetical protein
MNGAISALLELERREGLWTRQVLEYPVWAELRLGCYHRLLAEGAAAGGLPRALRRRRSWDRAPASARDIVDKLLPALRQRDIWVLGSTLYRRGDAEGTSRSIFAQHLEEQLGSRLVFLEANATSAERLPAPNVVFLDVLRDLTRTLASRSAGWLPAAWAQGLGRSELGLDARAVLIEALYGRAWRQVARALFAQGKPRAVFVLCAYGQHIPFQLEARARGIPVIELQHGVIHESHPGYVFGAGAAPQHAPDHLVVFGEHYGRLLEPGSSYWSGRWSVGGHPWLKAKRAAHAERPADDSIVLFGQNVPAVQQRLRALALELRRLLPAKARLVLKPHPAEKNGAEVYAGLAEQGVLIAAPGSDSYELLGRCRVAVSVFSTIAVEALAFRCASVVLRSPYWFEDIRSFVQQGFIQVADGSSDVLRVFREAGPARQSGLDRSLFGVGEPSLDFERLIGTLVAAGRSARLDPAGG